MDEWTELAKYIIANLTLNEDDIRLLLRVAKRDAALIPVCERIVAWANGDPREGQENLYVLCRELRDILGKTL